MVLGEITDHRIPAILTNSFRKNASFFGDKIVRLKARGGELPQKREELKPGYGLVHIMGKTNTIEIDYTQERSIGQIRNPLDKSNLEEILGHMDNLLDPYEEEGRESTPPDLFVEEMEVEIEDSEIQRLAKTATNTFDLSFISESPDNEHIWDEIHSLNVDLGIYSHGAKVRNLNLHRMVEVAEKFAESKKSLESIVHWEGFRKQDTRPHCPIGIAQCIMKHLPERPIGRLKTYLVTSEHRLELDGY